MADSDTFAVEDPQTQVVTAFAALRLFNFLAQTGPSVTQTYNERKAAYWKQEARERAVKYSMKQMPITRSHG